MTQPIARVDLSGTDHDFRLVAVRPGLPLLDKAHANSKTLQKWLGRMTAETNWDGDTVCFYMRNDAGDIQDAVRCRPATAADLKGPLKKEISDLEQRLEAIDARTPSERVLLKSITEQYRKQLSQLDSRNTSICFFVCRDERGKKRLVWCWGYQPESPDAARVLVCSNLNCSLLVLARTKSDRQCPRCQSVFQQSRSGAKWVATALLVLLLGAAAIGGASWYWSTSPIGLLTGDFFQTDRREESQPPDVEETPVPQPPVSRTAEAPPRHEVTQTTTIVGRVIDSITTKPIVGASIVVSGTDGVLETNQHGLFQAKVERGTAVTLDVSADGYASEHVTREPADLEADIIRIPLHGAAVLSGRVVDAGSETPIRGAVIQASQAPLKGETDNEGRFRLKGLRGGTAELEISAPGYSTQHLTQELRSDGETTIQVKLSGDATLTGQVIDALTKAPVAAAEIRIVGTLRKVRVDPSGRFRLESLKSGTTDVEVLATGYLPRKMEQTLSSDAQAPLTIELHGDTILAGRVMDAVTNAAIPNAEVQIPGTSHKIETDAKGQFRFEGLHAGSLEIEVAATGYASQRLKPNVASTNETSLLVRLQPQTKSPEPKREEMASEPTQAENIPDSDRTESEMPNTPIARADVTFTPPERTGQKTLPREFQERLDREGGKAGEIQATLIWNNKNDLDLHVVCPSGEEISFRHKRSRSGGELDVDMNAGSDHDSDRPVENVYWPHGKAPDGEYNVYVNHYANRGASDPTAFKVIVRYGGMARSFSGSLRHGDPKKLIHKFRYLGWLERAQHMIHSLGDSDDRVRQAARASLVELAGGEDHGPSPRATDVERAKSIAGWREWVERKKLIDQLATVPVGTLVSRFQHSAPQMRKAALAEARRRKLDKFEDFVRALRDPSREVRQEAQQALVEMANGSVSFGPPPNATDVDWASTAQKWKDWRTEQFAKQRAMKARQREQQAQGKMRLANAMRDQFKKQKTLDDERNRNVLKRRYQEIVDAYPGTRAAQEAQRQVDELK